MLMLTYPYAGVTHDVDTQPARAINRASLLVGNNMSVITLSRVEKAYSTCSSS